MPTIQEDQKVKTETTFQTIEAYVAYFEPLLLEDFKAYLTNIYQVNNGISSKHISSVWLEDVLVDLTDPPLHQFVCSLAQYSSSRFSKGDLVIVETSGGNSSKLDKGNAWSLRCFAHVEQTGPNKAGRTNVILQLHLNESQSKLFLRLHKLKQTQLVLSLLVLENPVTQIREYQFRLKLLVRALYPAFCSSL